MIVDLSELPIVFENDKFAVTIAPGNYAYTIGHVASYLNHSCDPTLIID